MGRWKFILVGLVVFCLAVWGLSRMTGSRGAAQAQKGRPNPLVVAKAIEPGRISASLQLTGSVEPTRVARLASPAEGPITNCCVREGDLVKEGEKVLSIGRKKATEALLASARQDVATEQEDLARIEKLVETGAIPRDQLDLARTKFHRAVAQLERVKESSDDYDVVVPWSGTVSKVLVADGNYVVPRTVMVEIFDPKSLVVRTAAPEAQSEGLRLGMDVGVTLDAYPGKTFRGKISRIYPELDRRMRTRIAEVEVMDAVDLVPGMFARLNVTLKSEKNALAVPQEAVIVTPKGIKVAYVLEGGKAVQRKVTTGIEGGGKIQVLSGLTVGDQLIVAGNEKLRDGLEVRVEGGSAEKPKGQGAAEKGAGRP